MVPASPAPILQDLARPELDDAIEANHIEGFKALAQGPHVELFALPGFVCTLGESDVVWFNNVFPVGLSTSAVQEQVEAALARLGPRNIQTAWWTGPRERSAGLRACLESKGFSHFFEVTGMAADLSNLRGGKQPAPELSVEEVTDQETLATWSRVLNAVWNSEEIEAFWRKMYASLGLGADRPWRHFVASLGGQVVGSSSLFLGAGVAGIACMGTLPEARRRGVSTALTLAPLRAARELGYRVGVLYSSSDAVEVYRRIGFEEYFKADLYFSPVPGAAGG